MGNRSTLGMTLTGTSTHESALKQMDHMEGHRVPMKLSELKELTKECGNGYIHVHFKNGEYRDNYYRGMCGSCVRFEPSLKCSDGWFSVDDTDDFDLLVNLENLINTTSPEVREAEKNIRDIQFSRGNELFKKHEFNTETSEYYADRDQMASEIAAAVAEYEKIKAVAYTAALKHYGLS